MSDAYRHHRAHAPQPSVIFVEVPVPVAGPDYCRSAKPPRYPNNSREPWRPATAPPRRLSKGERTVEFMRNISRQEIELRRYMDAARTASRQ